MICTAALAAGDNVKELQDRFDREARAVSRIKVLQKLGSAQFGAASKASTAGDYVAVGLIFEKYRDNVRVAYESLKNQEPDADKHPGGYRQLELIVRQGVREIEDTLIVAPDAMHPPLEIVHKDLIEIDDALIAALFPRRTKDPAKPAPPPGAKP